MYHTEPQQIQTLMAQGKKSFLMYCDWKETFDSLPDEAAGKLTKHIFAYVNDENPKSDDVLINAVFAQIKQALKRDLKKYERKCNKASESALIRWHSQPINEEKEPQPGLVRGKDLKSYLIKNDELLMLIAKNTELTQETALEKIKAFADREALSDARSARAWQTFCYQSILKSSKSEPKEKNWEAI